jgi:YtkA-like
MRQAILAVVLVGALGVTGCSHSKKTNSVLNPPCPKPPSTASAGNAQISAKALGKSYSKVVVIHANEKANGAPVHDGKVSIYAQMSCPHFMGLYHQKLKETSPGTYKTPYQLVMPGQWAFYIVVRDKNGNATTSALPVTVKVPGA